MTNLDGEGGSLAELDGPRTDPAGPALFEGYGIEIEWMTVAVLDRAVRPLAPMLLTDRGVLRDERDRGPMGWSNELATHVIEVKTLDVPPSLDGLAARFQGEAKAINKKLAKVGGRLLGGGAHPTMNPHTDATLWEAGQSEIYTAYDRIFDCRGHGWVNLQSTHLNIAFDGDDELRRLHAAVRLVLPLLPGLAAASPYLEGKRQPFLDARLDTYRYNQARIPEIAGKVIPEPIQSGGDYHRRILAPMYAAIAPHDPEGLLAEEWLNSRGAIVRFDRMALEIRVLDCQESPAQDLAIAAAAVAVIRALAEGKLPGGLNDDASTDRLAAHFWNAARHGSAATIDDEEYLACFGLSELWKPTLHELWRALLDRHPVAAEHEAPLNRILRSGTLAERMVRRAGGEPSEAMLVTLMAELSQCLAKGEAYLP
ncbi:MAG: glutamate--cysteine ligase [Deltaproteobacteria bacterium]|nr:glutamate--cysteine ligase [Deltaproteobacteria bacterium]